MNAMVKFPNTDKYARVIKASKIVHWEIEPDVIKGGKGIGPDADSGPTRRVGAALQDGDVMATALQGDGCRQTRNACTDHEELLLRHPSKVAPRPRVTIGRTPTACWWPSPPPHPRHR